MSHPEPFSYSWITCRNIETGQSSGNEATYDFPDSYVTQQNSWLQTSRASDTVASEVDDFQVFFGSLMDAQGSATSSVQANTSVAPKLETSCEPDKGQSTGVLRKCQSDATEASDAQKREHDDRPKRTRSAEVHNMSERRRRDRISKRLRTLRELIPNCNKTDRASVLDDAVNYLKALKLQVEMMSAGGGALLQTPYLSPCGIQNSQVPQISSFVPMRPELGMASGLGVGMAGICYSPGLGTMSVPFSGLHPSLAAPVGCPLMSAPGNLAIHQVQMPLIHSQALPPSVDTSPRLPNFFTGFSPAFSFSSQAESGSQTIQSTATDHQQVQMTNQESYPSVSSS